MLQTRTQRSVRRAENAGKAQACISCHARKVRCDLATHGSPCSPCQKSALACHEFHPKRRRVRAAEAALASTPIIVTDMRVSGPGHEAPLLLRPTSHDTLGEGDHEPRRIQVMGSQDIAKAGSILLDFLSQDFETEGSIGEYQATFVEDYANVVRMLGTIFGRGFQSNVKHFRDAPFIKRSNGSIPRAVTDEERAVLEFHGSFVLPDQRIAAGFVNAFFDRVYPTMPVVDQANLRRSVDDPNNPPPLLLLQAVILSGSTVWEHPDLATSAEEVSKRLFARAKALVDHRFEQDRLTLVVAHLLFSTYTCDSCDDTIQNMWLSLGSAVRIAQGLGMHRDLGKATADVKHRRQWKKVWWTLFLHDTLCSFEWGRPRAINLADSDVPEMQVADFDPTEPGALPCSEHVDFFMAALGLCFIVNDWLDCLRPGGGRRTAERSSAAAASCKREGSRRAREELQKWVSDLPPTMTPHRRPGSRCTLWSGTLAIAYHAALIRFLSISEAVDASRIMHDCAVSITKVCLDLYSQGLINSVWVFAIHQLYLAMCQHARESRDPDPSVAEEGLKNLQESMPILEKLSVKNSVARQAFVFLDEVAKGRLRLQAPYDWQRAGLSPWNIDSLPWHQFSAFDQDVTGMWDLQDDGVFQ